MENIVPSFKVFSLHVCYVCADTCVAVCDAHVKASLSLSLCMCEHRSEGSFRCHSFGAIYFFYYYFSVTGSLIGLKPAK